MSVSKATPHSKKAAAIQAHNAHLADVLDDLCMRFILNLPAEEYETFERLFFTIESAHWFYDDFFRENDNSLPRLPLKQFAARLFERTALLSPYRADVDRLTAQFQSYKQVVPTCGAALLNSALDKVVLVRGWGPNARWGFPKGKLAKDETEGDCAIREVDEEIGVDLSSLIDENTYAIDSFVGDRYSRIFIVPDVSEDTQFKTKTRKEISDIQWVSIDILPDSARVAKNAGHPAAKNVAKDRKGNKMLFAQHTLTPFTKRLRDWVSRVRQREASNGDITNIPLASADQSEIARQDIAEEPVEVLAPPAPLPPPSQEHDMVSLANVLEQDSVASTTPSERKKVSHGRGRGTGGGAMDRAAEGKRAMGRKGGRKVTSVAETSRNRTTFGSDGSVPLNDKERGKMFLQYVMETDQVVAENSIQDEFWPVRYLKSEDFSMEERRHTPVQTPTTVVEEAPVDGTCAEGRGTVEVVESCAKEALEEVLPRERVDAAGLEAFQFDRKAIVASMKAVEPS